MMNNTSTHAEVIAIQEGIVHLQQKGEQPIIKNGIVHICPAINDSEHIMAEVLHVKGDNAVAQVFEDTSGIAIDDKVVQSGEQLSVTLGPGLLGMTYEGLQNPLFNFSSKYGYFLPRGVREPAIELNKKWVFAPCVRNGDRVHAGSV